MMRPEFARAMAKTADKPALPSGLRLVLNEKPYAKWRTVADAFSDEGRVGIIEWDTKTGVVENIYVREALRRRGIASWMYEAAKAIEPRLQHGRDDALTPDGRAWRYSTGAKPKTAADKPKDRYVLVTQHSKGTKRVRFATYEEAVAAAEAINPDTDGSMYPNLPDADKIIAAYDKRGIEYEKGFFWGRTNRYAILFNLYPTP